ncbi:hypothetical protein ACFOU0_06980 [Salinicoccus sesuvii]|uniref:DUF3953 domain-containing protein n=1 Tax=Salinicoccus sesuvii TaxID=868281 RepID=A0ABV7N6W8_9STAP
MKNTVRLSLATYFIILSILYLSVQYTNFEMRSAIFIIASLVLIIMTSFTIKFRKDSDTMEWIILLLTIIMMVSFLLK